MPYQYIYEIMHQIKSLFFKYWPLIVLILLEIALFATNYIPHTYLMGWDNVMPEFNFKTNIMRNIVGVWQEHRGLGLYDGMSHIALTLHTIFIWFLSLFLPTNTLRYVFNILMHFLGGIGVYLLIWKMYSSREAEGRIEKFSKFSFRPFWDRTIISLIGSLFYLFNPATIQMFYTPLESFSVHFVALPWISLTLINYLSRGNKKSLFWFLIVCLLITPQYFITTLFIPTLIVIIAIIFTFLLKNKLLFKRGATALLAFFLINAFWLLPYIYGVPQNAPIIQSAKINQMSSQEVFLRNQAFGDLKNVFLLRGFSLDFTDLNSKGITQLIMQPWRDFLYHPLVICFSVILLIITLFGLIKYRKNRYLSPFLLIFVFCVVMLGTNIPVLKEFIEFLRKNIPLFSEIFRFTFTKFSLLFAFTYTLLLVNGLVELTKIIKFKKVIFILSILVVLSFSIPVFQGNFFYPQLRVNLPQDYVNLFKFMDKIDPNTRVTILPQSEFWSWKHYQFGYTGSGFLWYGLNQSMMDRAFDPWSNTNEGYYWELSQAIYQKNSLLFSQVLSKYGVSYLILDENLISSGNQLALYKDEIKQLINANENIEQIGFFGKLSVYQVKNTENKSYVSLTSQLPTVAPIDKWLDQDQAYLDLGNYISTDENSDIYYPFRSLFTKRNLQEQDFKILETDNQIVIQSENIPQAFLNLFPNEVATDGAKIRKNDQHLEVTLNKSMQVFQGDVNNVLNSNFINNTCDPFKKNVALNQIITEENISYLKLSATNQRNCLVFNNPNLEHKYSYLIAITSRNISGLPLRTSLINSTAKHVEMETFLPLNKDWQTNYLINPPLATDGVGFEFYLINDGIGSIKTENEIKEIKIYKIPYEFLKRVKAVNPVMLNSFQHPNEILKQVQDDTLASPISVKHPNPAEYIVSFQPSAISDQTINNNLTIEQFNNATLILNQSYNDGWQAYEIPTCDLSHVTCHIQRMFPFLFGKKLDHVLVNNWSNGWIIQPSAVSCQTSAVSNQLLDEPGNTKLKAESCNLKTNIYICFWPQLLEFLGFGLMLIPFLWLLKKNY